MSANGRRPRRQGEPVKSGGGADDTRSGGEPQGQRSVRTSLQRRQSTTLRPRLRPRLGRRLRRCVSPLHSPRSRFSSSSTTATIGNTAAAAATTATSGAVRASPGPIGERRGGEDSLGAVGEGAHAAEEIEPTRQRAEQRPPRGGARTVDQGTSRPFKRTVKAAAFTRLVSNKSLAELTNV